MSSLYFHSKPNMIRLTTIFLITCSFTLSINACNEECVDLNNLVELWFNSKQIPARCRFEKLEFKDVTIMTSQVVCTGPCRKYQKELASEKGILVYCSRKDIQSEWTCINYYTNDHFNSKDTSQFINYDVVCEPCNSISEPNYVLSNSCHIELIEWE